MLWTLEAENWPKWTFGRTGREVMICRDGTDMQFGVPSFGETTTWSSDHETASPPLEQTASTINASLGPLMRTSSFQSHPARNSLGMKPMQQ
eukprot:gene21521-biopygen1812